MTETTATRDQGEQHLRDVIPRMGRAYAAGRNFDHGPGRHRAVSTLSPWLRRRLVLEQDAVTAALEAHGAHSEKFVQEVVWRSYFKGWLEQRPSIWRSYREGLAADLAHLDRDAGLAARVAAVETGATGIDCMDAWARELRETGYLHNHARMWFASIWIFTLELPWRVGADYFLRHLLDGDPASNTLSWRWVAGLHTRGKPYEARADNIATFTDGRLQPDPTQLARNIIGLEMTEPDGLPRPQMPDFGPAPDPRLPALLLITEDDCRPEDFGLSAHDIRGAATLAGSHLRSPRPVSEAVAAFEAGALADAAIRAGLPGTALRAEGAKVLVAAARAAGARQIVTPWVPQGPLRDWLDATRPTLAASGLDLRYWTREWDRAFWPLATAGFFKVKERIPRVLAGLGLDPAA